MFDSDYLSKFKRKIKFFHIKYIRNISRKINSNVKLEFAILAVFFLIIIYYLLFPKSPIVIYNETFFITRVGFKFKDYSMVITSFIGIFGFLLTLLTIKTNFKSSKLTALPDNSVDLLIELEYYFNEYQINKDDEDIISLFVDILKYWKNHQKALRLLCPNFYKNFLKIHTMTLKPIEKKEIPQTNSQYIIKAMKTQIFDIAFGNSEKFYFIKPNLIKDDRYISNLSYLSEKCYASYKLDKKGLKNYINLLDTNTNQLCVELFEDFCLDLENLLYDLKEEINKYDSI